MNLLKNETMRRVLGWTWTVFRTGALVAPFLWIYFRVHWDVFIAQISGVPWWVVPVVLLLSAAIYFQQGFRWWILLRAYIPELPFGRTFSAHLKGLFYSIVLPSSAPQDIIRAAILSRDNKYEIVWGATWLCKVMAFLVLMLFTVFGLFLIDRSRLPVWVIRAIAGAGAIILLLVAVSFSKSVTRHFRGPVSGIIPSRFFKIIEQIRQAIYLYRDKKAEIFSVFCITLVLQFISCLIAIIILKGVSGSWYIRECLFFSPLIEVIVIFFPITPNGVGIREILFAVFFRYLHLSNEMLGVFIPFALLSILLRVAGAIPILYEFARGTKKIKG
jgi:glycosyltransferase 2 family protein